MKKDKINGLVGTIVIHAIFLVLLFVFVISTPLKQEEGGVSVMLGSVDEANGNAQSLTMTDVDITDEPFSSSSESANEQSASLPNPDKLISQSEEKTIEVKKDEKADHKKIEKKEKVKPKKMTAEELKAAKIKKEAQEKAEKEKAAAIAAQKKISGAFGKGTQMGNSGNSSGKGAQGSKSGNSDHGSKTGIGGYGSFDLNGRSLGNGHLPTPIYNVQDEGKVVVTIIVNPSGEVVSTSINKNTNTINPALRRAAENAAKKARFNSVSGVNNQSGTITYYFKLK